MPTNRKKPPAQLKIKAERLTKTAEDKRADKKMHYSDEEIILIVLDAKAIGTKRAAIKYGTTVETITNWRKRIDQEPDLKDAFLQKDHEIRHDFERETADAIKAALDFIKRAAEACDVTNPAQIRAVAGAMKMAAEFRLANEITIARLGKDRPQALPPGQDNNKYVLESRFEKIEHINSQAGVESVIDGEFEE